MSTTHTQKITEIPLEIWIIIFSKLKITDAVNLGRVNKRIRQIYLDLVNRTKYIEYTKYKEHPNNDITKYIKNILQNISMGNRTVILKIYPDEDISPSQHTPESPIFKIINLLTPSDAGNTLKIYLINNHNIRIIYFNILDNTIRCDIEKENNDLVLKFIENTPFSAKLRPMKYTFENNQLRHHLLAGGVKDI